MIYDKIENIHKYKDISPWMEKAVEFLQKQDLTKLPMGRTEIFEDKVFANVMEAQAGPPGERNFEIHQKYMDIQIDIKGVEAVQTGLGECKALEDFNEETDFGTVICEDSAKCVLGAGRFIVCMKEEPHKPGIAVAEDTALVKCVIKVAAEVGEDKIE